MAGGLLWDGEVGVMREAYGGVGRYDSCQEV